MSDRWPKESLDKVYFCQSVLEESVHDAQGIVTTLLPQEPSIVIDTYVSITMFACHSLASFPTCAITLWRPLEFENFRKKTPKCTWLCTGISPVCSTDPIKSQKTWQVFCTGKKNFARGVRAFCEWLCKWRTFRPPWPTLPGLGRQPLVKGNHIFEVEMCHLKLCVTPNILLTVITDSRLDIWLIF